MEGRLIEMYQVKLMNKIAACGLEVLDDSYTCGEGIENPDAILVRSAALHDMEFPESLRAIARAGAGTNNIPVEACSERGIVVFNTPGANANAVKELVLCGLLMASRKIVPALNWAQTLKGQGDQVLKLVEKGKGAFVGPEIKGKKLGVIGLGAIGVLVANSAASLGMTVYGYDPYLSVDAAWGLSRRIIHAKSVEEIYAQCDYITVHVPLNDKTKHMIGQEALGMMKPTAAVLNFSRDELVDGEAVLAALEKDTLRCYVTDFPTDNMLGNEKVVALPHLGASTPESEDNCAVMAAQEIRDYLENGNIVNSVNFPNAVMERSGKYRYGILHRNIPSMISQATNAFAEQGINIENMMNKSKKDYAYTVIDAEEKSQAVIDRISAVDGVVKVNLYE